MIDQDIDFIAVYGRSGMGKTTLSVAFALDYALQYKIPIVSNMPLTNIQPVIASKVLTKAEEFLSAENCVILADQLDHSLPSSSIGPTKTEREKKLLEMVANARKNGVVAIIFNAQWRHSVRNFVRINCKYICEPTRTNFDNYPEYFVWTDYDEYENDRRHGPGKYQNATLAYVKWDLDFLTTVFNTRNKIEIEW